MTYKLNPELRKIQSPIVLIFPDGETCAFTNGTAVTEAIFNKGYQVEEMRALGNIVEIKLIERDVSRMDWIGDESFD